MLFTSHGTIAFIHWNKDHAIGPNSNLKNLLMYCSIKFCVTLKVIYIYPTIIGLFLIPGAQTPSHLVRPIPQHMVSTGPSPFSPITVPKMNQSPVRRLKRDWFQILGRSQRVKNETNFSYYECYRKLVVIRSKNSFKNFYSWAEPVHAQNFCFPFLVDKVMCWMSKVGTKDIQSVC